MNVLHQFERNLLFLNGKRCCLFHQHHLRNLFNATKTNWMRNFSVKVLSEHQEKFIFRLNKQLSNFSSSSHSCAQTNNHSLEKETITVSNIYDLNDLILRNGMTMNAHQLSSVFALLHNLILHSETIERNSVEFLSSDSFRLLQKTTLIQMKYFDSVETLNILKTLILLKLSPQTHLMSKLLKQIRSQLNTFSLDQLCFLYFLLYERLTNEDTIKTEPEESIPSRETGIPLVEAVKLGLNFMIQEKLLNEDSYVNDTDLLSKSLQIAVRRKFNSGVLFKLITSLDSNLIKITKDQAIVIILALVNSESIWKYPMTEITRRMLEYCAHLLTSADTLPPHIHPTLFVKCLLLSLRKCPDIFKKEAYDFICKIVLENTSLFNISRIVKVLRQMNAFGYFNYDLNDYVAREIYENPGKKILVFDQVVDVLEAFSLSSEYKRRVENPDLLYSEILTSIRYSSFVHGRHYLVQILKCFIVLGFVPYELSYRVACKYLPRATKQATSRGKRKDHLAYLALISQGLSLMGRPDTDYTLHLDALQPYLAEHNYINTLYAMDECAINLLPHLTSLLGCESFVSRFVCTKYGHLMDYLFAVKDGNFIDVNDLLEASSPPLKCLDLSRVDESCHLYVN